MERDRLRRKSEVLPGEFVEERIHPDNYMFSRHLFAYQVAAKYLRPGEIAVDVGSGDGYGVQFMTERGARVVGIDRDWDALAPAASTTGRGTSLYVQADVREIPLQNETANLVTSMQVLEHLEGAEKYASEIRRLLKAGGTAVISTPYRDSNAFRFQPEISPYHVKEYCPEDLLALLSPLFDDIKIHGIRFRAGTKAKGSDEKLGFIQKIDRLNVRRLVPPTMKPFVYRLFGFTPVSEFKIAVEDYELCDNGNDPSVMDLLAVCHV